MKISFEKFQGLNVVLKRSKKQKMPDKCTMCKFLCNNIVYYWCGNKDKKCKQTNVEKEVNHANVSKL